MTIAKHTISALVALSLVAAACVAARAEGATRSALKGCLLASPAGAYQLTDDTTGTVYTLVGNSEALGLLVGADVLVTGSLTQNEGGATPPHQGQSARASNADETSENDSPSENSFRVASAVKFNDLCALSASSKIARQPDARPDAWVEAPRPDSDTLR